MPPTNAMVDNRAFTAYNMVSIKLWSFTFIIGHLRRANCRSDLQVATSSREQNTLRRNTFSKGVSFALTILPYLR